jgi:hypothetical protein
MRVKRLCADFVNFELSAAVSSAPEKEASERRLGENGRR